MDVVDALGARSGVVCAVGAGGKKTTLYTLADRTTRDWGNRTVVTATVRIPIFDPHVEEVVVTDDPTGALSAAESWPVGVVPERERDDRYRGYDTAVVDDLAASGLADPILVKADGARTRLLKAPDEGEPQLPARADTVIPIASVRAVGEPLSPEFVHRPERVAAITGRRIGDEIRPRDVAAVLSSDRGGRKAVPDDATVVPLLNAVDDRRLRSTAVEVAEQILESTDEISRVVLARMRASEPLVEIVR